MTTIPKCSLCQFTDGGSVSGENKAFPHWGLAHVCRACWETSRRWKTWTEDDLVATQRWRAKPEAMATVFYLINKSRRQKRGRARTKRMRQIGDERRVTKGHGRILPNLRRSKMKELGFSV